MADNYKVTGQRQTVDIGGDGRFRDVIEVSFTDTHDNHGTVKVPVNMYNVETVREAIEARVAQMDSVHTL